MDSNTFRSTLKPKKIQKIWIYFSCFITRVVHLQVCPFLSSDLFLCALLRFVYSRDHSTKQIWSDNGSHIIGADNEILQVTSKLDDNRITNCMSHVGSNGNARLLVVLISLVFGKLWFGKRKFY